MLEQCIAAGRAFPDHGCVAVPMPLADQALVGAGEFLRAIVKARFAYPHLDEIAVQRSNGAFSATTTTGSPRSSGRWPSACL